MKTDNYTKILLTIIAGCLTVLTLSNFDFIPKLNAGTANNLETKSNYRLVPTNEDGSINVRLMPSGTMDVNIESCSSTAFYMAEPIKVKIKQ